MTVRSQKLGAIVLLIAALSIIVGCGSLSNPEQQAYNAAVELFNNMQYEEALDAFVALGDYRDAATRAGNSRVSLYNRALAKQGKFTPNSRPSIEDILESAEIFMKISDYKDASKQADDALGIIYNRALTNMDRKRYDDAIELFITLGDYMDTSEIIKECKYCIFVNLLEEGEYEQASEMLSELGDYKDAATLAETAPTHALYTSAVSLMNEENYKQAIEVFSELGEYEDSPERIDVCIYNEALSVFGKGDFDLALILFETLPDGYEDIELYIDAISAVADAESGDWLSATRKFDNLDKRVQALTNVRSEEYRISLIKHLNTPVLEKLPKQISVRDSFRLCLVQYYYEQSQLGNDITQLLEYPYSLTNRDSAVYDAVWDMCLDKLRASMEERGFDEEYFRTQSSHVSPENVPGNGFYIVPIEGNYKSHVYGKLRNIAPFCIAVTPDDVRYVFFYYEHFTRFGTYDDGTTGYKSNTIIDVMDVVTGENVYHNFFSTDPPRTAPKTGRDTYGSDDLFRTTMKILEDEVLPAIENAGITVY